MFPNFSYVLEINYLVFLFTFNKLKKKKLDIIIILHHFHIKYMKVQLCLYWLFMSVNKTSPLIMKMGKDFFYKFSIHN